MIPSGQAFNSDAIENYPGFPDGISGQELIERFARQATKFGLEIQQFTQVDGIQLDGNRKIVTSGAQRLSSRTVIIASGAQWNKLGVPGEEEFSGRGISYCATCDGAFFKDQVVAVVGGGDTALEDALYLTRIVPKVYVIHRRDQLRAQKLLQARAFANSKIEFVWDTVVREIVGNDTVTTLRIENVKTAEERQLAITGVFVAIGQQPNTTFVRGLVDLDEQGYIVTDDGYTTSVPGIFAAGDVRKKNLRQISTAVGDGATAAYAAEKYIVEQG
jgi:thioredoxin reductase (NADPH)